MAGHFIAGPCTAFRFSCVPNERRFNVGGRIAVNECCFGRTLRVLLEFAPPLCGSANSTARARGVPPSGLPHERGRALRCRYAAMQTQRHGLPLWGNGEWKIMVTEGAVFIAYHFPFSIINVPFPARGNGSAGNGAHICGPSSSQSLKRRAVRRRQNGYLRHNGRGQNPMERP
jgi:hypothetical protein